MVETQLATVVAVLDWLGLVVFAVSGALVASRKQMDIVGFVMLGTVTGIGGGTLRDVLLGKLPVFWVKQPAVLAVCIATSAIAFFLAHIPQSRLRVLLWLDAVGLALYAVTGAETALAVGAPALVAVTMGVITATFGGIIRDLLGGEESIILRPEIYVTAALLGAVVFVGAVGAGVSVAIASIAGFASAFALRGLALAKHLTLPRYKARPGRSHEEI